MEAKGETVSASEKRKERERESPPSSGGSIDPSS